MFGWVRCACDLCRGIFRFSSILGKLDCFLRSIVLRSRSFSRCSTLRYSTSRRRTGKPPGLTFFLSWPCPYNTLLLRSKKQSIAPTDSPSHPRIVNSIPTTQVLNLSMICCIGCHQKKCFYLWTKLTEEDGLCRFIIAVIGSRTCGLEFIRWDRSRGISLRWGRIMIFCGSLGRLGCWDGMGESIGSRLFSPQG